MESSRGFKSNPGAPSFIFNRKKEKKRPVILGVHGSVQDEIEDLWKALNGLFWGLKKAECWIMLPSRRGHPESKRNSSVKWHLCVSILQDRSLLSICIHLKPLQVIFMDSNLSVPPLKDPPGALEFFFFFHANPIWCDDDRTAHLFDLRDLLQKHLRIRGTILQIVAFYNAQ